jgi:hypothetical protein
VKSCPIIVENSKQKRIKLILLLVGPVSGNNFVGPAS